ncbi:DNA-formamidopyrimidine glycosylase [Caldibacillus lycopersici]|uniref:Formamidopyrimidine-DNA glycosylase n=1 Tax=Perspicuibacillus lycopersici TaxID=1325689 RepID=A0AAE3IU25_9BACI|nr:DNA-formamidopyrimidine glycosylase [Perspicuibacillus lycopersici]MCU9614177.1 DNA-formamidopyrimidine glycosylase [Perspicuibacillus lycopersici]
MPELPEVETVRKTLEALVIGKTIEEIQVFWPKIIKQPDDVQEFIQQIKGQTIRRIGRRGKFLIFYLDEDALISHLRMEGKYGVHAKEEAFDKHTHVIFFFTDGTQLRYRDVRKFGTMHVFPIGEEFSQLPLKQLGPEPFDKDFTLRYFGNALSKTTRNIKAVLLDQTVVTGLGNIYVDESLFRAKIHPERLANTLSQADIKRLRTEIIATLQEAVEKGGSTVRSYVNSQGQIGMFQLELNVYGQEGKPCKRCGTLIEKTKVSGRGTHICPKCQKNQ